MKRDNARSSSVLLLSYKEFVRRMRQESDMKKKRDIADRKRKLKLLLALWNRDKKQKRSVLQKKND